MDTVEQLFFDLIRFDVLKLIITRYNNHQNIIFSFVKISLMQIINFKSTLFLDYFLIFNYTYIKRQSNLKYNLNSLITFSK